MKHYIVWLEETVQAETVDVYIYENLEIENFSASLGIK